MSNTTFPIVDLEFKSASGAKDLDQDIRLDHISAIIAASKNEIDIKMINGYSFRCPAAIGIQVSQLWHKLATGEIGPGVYPIKTNTKD